MDWMKPTPVAKTIFPLQAINLNVNLIHGSFTDIQGMNVYHLYDIYLKYRKILLVRLQVNLSFLKIVCALILRTV